MSRSREVERSRSREVERSRSREVKRLLSHSNYIPKQMKVHVSWIIMNLILYVLTASLPDMLSVVYNHLFGGRIYQC